MFKRFLCVFFSMILCASFSVNLVVSADDTVDYLEIITILRGVESNKAQLGLENVNFNNIEIASPISVYEFKNDTVCEMNYDMFPLIYDSNIIAWAINSDVNNCDQYQITTELTDSVNEIIDMNTEFAIIYDSSSCYLFDGNELLFLEKLDFVTTERETLYNVSDIISTDNIVLNSINESTLLGYSGDVSRAVTSYYGCSVDYVTQNPYDNLCWAASVACIENYVHNNDLTALDVELDYKGENTDSTISASEFSVVLSYYDLAYIFNTRIPSGSAMVSNLQRGFPMLGIFSVSESMAHAAVIYGVNIISGYIYVMDPMFGFTSAGAGSGTYSYVSNGRTLSLGAACCRFWS